MIFADLWFGQVFRFPPCGWEFVKCAHNECYVDIINTTEKCKVEGDREVYATGRTIDITGN